MASVTPYKSSPFYFRAALRGAETKAEAVEVGLHAVAELERLKEWVRARGLVPPKWHITQSEIDEKDWGAVVPFQTKAECAPRADSLGQVSTLSTSLQSPAASMKPVC